MKKSFDSYTIKAMTKIGSRETGKSLIRFGSCLFFSSHNGEDQASKMSTKESILLCQNNSTNISPAEDRSL